VAVHFVSRRDQAEEVVKEIRSRGGEAIAVKAELSDPVQVVRMTEQVLDQWGDMEVLINNAAVIQDAPVIRLQDRDWDFVVGTDLAGPFYTMRSVAPVMKRSGGGWIVNIVSRSGVRGNRGQANYAAAKAGLIGLTRAAALEWGRFNIRVNAVSPGFMKTEMTGSVSSAVRNLALRQSCLNCFCDPGEVARFILSLTRMKGVTGQLFHVDSRLV